MNLPPNQFAEQVWLRTVPALRHRRLTRRATRAGAGATTLLLAVLTIALWTNDTPAEYHWISGIDSPVPEPAESPSLAVLVVDHSGARFQQLDPAELAGEGLTCQLTLDPVITGPVSGLP